MVQRPFVGPETPHPSEVPDETIITETVSISPTAPVPVHSADPVSQITEIVSGPLQPISPEEERMWTDFGDDYEQGVILFEEALGKKVSEFSEFEMESLQQYLDQIGVPLWFQAERLDGVEWPDHSTIEMLLGLATVGIGIYLLMRIS